MDTIRSDLRDGRQRRRRHSDEFKSQVVAECSRPGVSIAAVALHHGLNANLLRRWVPDGQSKFPHLWPPQIPPGKTGRIMTTRC